MTDMIEQVARAIWIIQRRDLDKCDMELEDVGNRYETYDMATDAIKPMREPTDEMINAVTENISVGCCGVHKSEVMEIMGAMIDAALGEKK